jgi:hypothetical protein
MNCNYQKSSWQAQIDERLEIKKDRFGLLDGYPGIVKVTLDRGGPFVNWHLLARPAGVVEEYLGYCMNIYCVYPSHDFVKTFLEWANEAADRALTDIRFKYDPDEERAKGNPDPLAKRGWKIPGIYPGNHGSTLAAACFARSLRDNSELDEASLLQAAQEISESALDTTSREWTCMPQSDYLRCIRLCLLAGRTDKAMGFFKNTRRKFKATQHHHQWLHDLCMAIEEAKEGPLSERAVAAFQTFFDVVRDPAIRSVGDEKDGSAVSTNISLLRLELALIKQRYILRQPIQGNWTAILMLISE